MYKMKIKHNKSFHLKVPRFEVDGFINQELETYDVFKHLNRHSFTTFLGTSGSGKTSLMYSFLTNTKPKIWRKQFESIIVVMPTQSRNSLKNNIFDKYIDADCLFDNLTEETVDLITEKVEHNAQIGIRTLIILDDVASQLKNREVVKKLQHLIYAYRHYRCNILMLVQTMKTIPLSIRKNMTNLVVFHRPRLSEWDAITHEFLEIDKPTSKELYNTVFTEKYDWCLINLQTGRIYKKFNEVIYK